MTTMASQITLGADTHLEVHVAAALDERGALLDVGAFHTAPAGYEKLLDWACSFGQLERRTSEGLSKKEAIRCLTRYVAREVFNQLPRGRLT